ncbi:unnamed protein product [Adineta ricciae]|uniref:NADP-dependent oxidoreductase domain-containing protein n=1 Tax=Adineta ricciae TaxID=249248 RepID=A0A814T4Y2_ADIRI|nr:unnamed protein product [Adineta ricciae]CAF1153497.1 unnamed protein product [Adineta ricciae]
MFSYTLSKRRTRTSKQIVSGNATLRLIDGNRIPLFGLGLYEVDGSSWTTRLVKSAITMGYRLFDTAEVYENEHELGEGIRKSSVAREQVYITSKVYTTEGGRRQVLDCVRQSLMQLMVDYIDLYLIHAPQGGHVLEAYDALHELRNLGRIRSVGVSNFGIPHLEVIRKSGRPLPVVNQIELHPFCQQRPIVSYCRRHGIALMAYSPMARGAALNDPFVLQLARKYRRTPAQILLRWSVQNGFIPIPKTNHPNRLKENFQVFDFRLSANDMRQLTDYGYQQPMVSGWNPVSNTTSQFGAIY